MQLDHWVAPDLFDLETTDEVGGVDAVALHAGRRVVGFAQIERDAVGVACSRCPGGNHLLVVESNRTSDQSYAQM